MIKECWGKLNVIWLMGDIEVKIRLKEKGIGRIVKERVNV